MELRHLRYFVAVAEERSFVRAARRLRLTQPALSRQIRDLEGELGVTLFHRLPRGVQLTPAGEAFLAEARNTIQDAARAIASARRADVRRASCLHFVLREMVVYAPVVAELLARFRLLHPSVEVEVSSLNETEQREALRSRWADVALTIVTTSPIAEFNLHRLVDFSLTGVLLPGSHPLAAKTVVQLRQLEDLTFLDFKSAQWPEAFSAVDQALAQRGVTPRRHRERSAGAPTVNLQIAAGGAWALANQATAAIYGANAPSIVYRPFVEPPIPAWLALIWLGGASHLVHRLVDVACGMGLTVGDDDPTGSQP
jgi:DNA-binding transcriptional LysR family regulator